MFIEIQNQISDCSFNKPVVEKLPNSIFEIFKGQVMANENKDSSVKLETTKRLARAKITRRYPPISGRDTVILKKGVEPKSVHGEGQLFTDEEIIEFPKVLKRQKLTPSSTPVSAFSVYSDKTPLYAYYSSNGKAIIQQQSVRGCTAAVTAMLIVDHKKKCSVEDLRSRCLGDDRDMLNDIETAGLSPKINYLANSLADLKQAIVKGGSAIVNITGELSAHVIVVDEVLENGVRLRDPYHGWEIVVSSEAFMQRYSGGQIIQITQ